MTNPAKLIVGSRGSTLALWQARRVAARLEAMGAACEIRIIKTTGDKMTDVPLAKVGGKGLFTKEIEEALLAGEIDLAVHSLKDLPTVVPEGLTVAAIPEREDPRDALLGKPFEALAAGMKVGTSSLRRAAQLKNLVPGLVIEDLRGNLDTRVRKLEEGQYDAIVLAAAGLSRLGWEDKISDRLEPTMVCPAAGQGALAIETRDHGPAFELCRALDDAPARAAVTAERALLAALGGGCQAPIGAHAFQVEDRLHLMAVVLDPETGAEIRAAIEGSEPEVMGMELARTMLEDGARAILEKVHGHPMPLAGQRVVVTRARKQSSVLTEMLASLGAEVVELPVIEFAPMEFEAPAWKDYDWAIFTSANAVEALFSRLAPEKGPRLAAIGPATADALRAVGLEPDIIAGIHVAEGVVDALANTPLEGKRVLLPRAAVARDVIPAELSARGASVDVLPVYRTVVPAELAARAAAVFGGARKPDWVTLTSGSTVKNLLAAVGGEMLEGVKLASIGPVTSETARRHGLRVTLEASSPTMEALAEAMAEWSGGGDGQQSAQGS
jgi:hydroxymethylbilane synthase